LEEALSWFSQAMGPTIAALWVIESGSHRWKPHHFQLMKKKEMV